MSRSVAGVRGSEAAANGYGHSGRRRTFVHDLEVVASVGVYQHEQHFEQRIIISIDLEICDRYDGHSDRLDDVFDYVHAIRAARQVAESRHFNLIETLGEQIAEACLDHADVLVARVKVEKPDVLDYCRSVGIEIQRQKPGAQP